MQFPTDTYPMLGHIDPYGKTVFNRHQMVTLAEEITSAKKTFELSAGQSSFLDEVAVLCRKGLRPPHRLLYFLGE